MNFSELLCGGLIERISSAGDPELTVVIFCSKTKSRFCFRGMGFFLFQIIGLRIFEFQFTWKVDVSEVFNLVAE